VVLLWTSRYTHVIWAQRPYYALLVTSFIVEIAAMVLMVQGKPNVELYQFYSLVEILLLLLFAQLVLRKRWSLFFVLGIIAFCALLLYHDIRSATGFHILHAKSLLVGWGAITFLFAKLLLDVAISSTLKLWRDQRFWVYLSIFLFMAPAIPYIGLLDHLYKRDPQLALDLYTILHVLFFVRYGCALVAGLLLKHRTGEDER